MDREDRTITRSSNLRFVRIGMLLRTCFVCLQRGRGASTFRDRFGRGRRGVEANRNLFDSEQGMSHAYAYPRPSVTVDVAVLAKGSHDQHVKLLLIRRKKEPYVGCWALPGGFVEEMEPLMMAARRELEEETSLSVCEGELRQVGAFGDPGRDPRGWTITVAYACLLKDSAEHLNVKAADDASEAEWFRVGQLPNLAFDHRMIVLECFRQVRSRQECSEDSILRLRLDEAIDALL